MATVCTTCGQELPRDDAHFCNNCGTLVPSHPFSAQSLAANAVQQEAQKPVLREQRVQPSAAKPAVVEQKSQQAQRSPRTTRRIAPDDISKSAIAWPAPLTHVSVKESLIPSEAAQVESQAKQAAQTPTSAPAPARELHVKVWEQERINPLTPLPTSNEDGLQAHNEHTPTTPLVNSGSRNVEDAPTIIQSRDTAVEYLDTVPMPNYPQPKASELAQQAVVSPRSLPGNPNFPVDQLIREQSAPPYHVSGASPIPQPAASAAPQAVPQSRQMNIRSSQQQYQQPMAVQEIKPPPVATLPPATATRQKSRVPFIILLASLCVLILGGGAWIVLANPFAVPVVTQPLQSFKDTQLGVSLSYPSGWTSQKSATGVVFADSSHTAQANLSATATSGDVATYIQRQATKSGMTSVKTLGTVSFAGTSWQHLQGNVVQGGVNYTTHMFATMHSNRTYTLTQIAPQNVYSDEETIVFSSIRSSFTFL